MGAHDDLVTAVGLAVQTGGEYLHVIDDPRSWKPSPAVVAVRSVMLSQVGRTITIKVVVHSPQSRHEARCRPC